MRARYPLIKAAVEIHPRPARPVQVSLPALRPVRHVLQGRTQPVVSEPVSLLPRAPLCLPVTDAVHSLLTVPKPSCAKHGSDSLCHVCIRQGKGEEDSDRHADETGAKGESSGRGREEGEEQA